ncbi:hypothetical protein [Nocardia asteroides]|uniref:hypothetical protein n=1 Tax=Nocardia asteroides TaxID=1824 RepID=UPI003443D390
MAQASDALRNNLQEPVRAVAGLSGQAPPAAGKPVSHPQPFGIGAAEPVGVPSSFDRSLSTLVSQLKAMEDAGWVTTVAESGEFK